MLDSVVGAKAQLTGTEFAFLAASTFLSGVSPFVFPSKVGKKKEEGVKHSPVALTTEVLRRLLNTSFPQPLPCLRPWPWAPSTLASKRFATGARLRA